jgi:uncharacterized protein with HEPN domain
MRSEADFLQDMLDSALRLQREIAGKSYAQFQGDETIQDAVVLRLIVIGEAAKKISPATRALLPQLPFDEIARMRDVLSHVYWRINYQIVWDTATRDVPEVIRHVAAHFGASAGTGSPP